MRSLCLSCGVVVLLVAGCRSDVGRPSTDLMTKAELNAKADALIEEGEDQRLRGMNVNRGAFRRTANEGGRLVRDGDDKIQEGQRLKKLATTRP